MRYAIRLTDTAVDEMMSGPGRQGHRQILEGLIAQVIERCAQEAERGRGSDEFHGENNTALDAAARRIRALAAPPAGLSVPAEPDLAPRGTALWNEVIAVVFDVSTQKLPTNLATAAIVRIFERHQQAAAPPAGVGAEPKAQS